MRPDDLIDIAARRRVESPPPPSAVQADVRELPYPFHYFFSIASDCDGPIFERFLRVGQAFREEFGLPIADSIIPGWLHRAGQVGRYSKERGPSKTQPIFDRNRLIEKVGEILSRYHRGWYDVTHGWIQRFMIKIAGDFELTVSGFRRFARRTAKFTAPPGWQQLEPPRFLVMRYALPMAGSSFRMIGQVGKEKVFELPSSDFEPECRFLPMPLTVDLYPLMGNDPDRLHNLKLHFSMTGPRGSKLVVRDLALLSDTRETVKEEITTMKAFNIFLSTFTSHGVGAVLGVRSCIAPESADPRWCADFPGNIHYLKDLLSEYGIRFFNTFSNTSRSSVLPLRSVIKPCVFYDGTLGYDFNRYRHLPQNQAGGYDLSFFSVDGQDTNPSVADYVGFHLNAAVRQMQDFSDGALLYTHAGVRDKVIMEALEKKGRSQDPMDTINDETRQALGDLARLHFGLDDAVEHGQRIWVAPTGAVLRQARLARGAGGHVWYDKQQNAVFVQTWFDPITQEPVPNPAYEYLDIAGLTVYVDDSATARLFVDGRPVTHLIRSPKDHTGRESVTVADVYSPTVVLDDVDMKKKPGALEEEGAVYRYCTSDSFRGTACYEMKVSGAGGRLVWHLPAPMPLADQFHLRFAYRKEQGPCRIAVVWHLANGRQFAVAEEGAETDTHSYRIAPWEDGEWRDVIVPFYALLGALPAGERFIPAHTALAKLEFNAKGDSRSVVHFDTIELLRDDANPRSRDGRFLVGGRAWISQTRGQERITRVVLRLGRNEYSTSPASNGYYFFEEKIPRGAVVEILGLDNKGGEVEPVFGRHWDIWTNTTWVDFGQVSRGFDEEAKTWEDV